MCADVGIGQRLHENLGAAKIELSPEEVAEVRKIAETLGITPAQAIISWHVQRGTVVLPKSVTPSRVEENFKGK